MIKKAKKLIITKKKGSNGKIESLKIDKPATVIVETMEAENRRIAYGQKFKLFQSMLIENPFMSPSDIAYKIYNCKSKATASQISSQNLRKLNISMNDILIRYGIDDKSDINLLRKLRNSKTTKFATHEGQICDERECEDNATQTKALELTHKLKGNITNVVNNTTNYNQLNVSDVKFTGDIHIGQAIRDFTNRLSEAVKGKSRL